MDIQTYIQTLGKKAKQASVEIAKADTHRKNQALNVIADLLMQNQSLIIEENQKDLQAGKDNGLSDALLDRLALDNQRITAMAEGMCQIAKLPDPVGEILDLKYMPSGIQVGKMTVPLGVIGMIYESRPNVTTDAAALCLKSGNAVILRGGSEATYSNQIIANQIKQGLLQANLSEDAVQVVKIVEREAVNQLLKLDAFVDVIIPRGGKGLVKLVNEKSTIPVIKHLDGVCHVYIDKNADLVKAEAIAINAKTRRYGVCNAMESLLVNKAVASKILPKLAKTYQEKGVELRGCPQTYQILSGSGIKLADESDWYSEYLAPILSIKVVASADEAFDHINRYGSHHTDAIVTEDYTLIRRFLSEVDSSSVIVNASTSFADGFEYGLGAEIGISTDKIHVRGPVGLQGLTSQKYIVFGDGQIRP